MARGPQAQAERPTFLNGEFAPQPKKKKKRKPIPPPNPEFAEECLDWAFGEEERESTRGKFIAFLVVAAGLGAGVFFFGPHIKPMLQQGMAAVNQMQSEQVTPDRPVIESEELSGDPVALMAGAQESLAQKDYPLAVAQLRKAVLLLEQEEDVDSKEILQAKLSLADATYKNGDFKDFHTQWSRLGQDYAELSAQSKKNLEKADRELRILAKKQLEASRKALKSGDTEKATLLADEAVALNRDHKGPHALLAASHEAAGDAYLAEGNTKVAGSHYAEANRLKPNAKYKAKLAKIKTYKPSKTNKPKKVKVVEANYIPKASVPTGKTAVRRSASRPNSKVEAAPTEPKGPARMKEIPAYTKLQSKKKKRSTTDNAPPGYYD